MACTSPQCYLQPFGQKKLIKSLEDYPSGVYPGLGKVFYLPCGHCLACRRNRRQELTLLQCCEASLYDHNWFITLTYDDNKVVKSLGYPLFLLNKQHISDFLVSLRKGLLYKGVKARYFGCGEYGDTYNRPHYHMSLFGVDPKILGIQDCSDVLDSRRDLLSTGVLRTPRNCSLDSKGNYFWQSPFIASRWTFGNHMIYRACRETFQYVAGYVVKKLNGEKQKYAVPEFSFQSRPSIGYEWFLKYCNSLSIPDGDRLINDVLEIAGKTWCCPRIFSRWMEQMDYFDGVALNEKVKRIRLATALDVPDRDKLRRKAKYDLYRDMVSRINTQTQKKGLNNETVDVHSLRR